MKTKIIASLGAIAMIVGFAPVNVSATETQKFYTQGGVYVGDRYYDLAMSYNFQISSSGDVVLHFYSEEEKKADLSVLTKVIFEIPVDIQIRTKNYMVRKSITWQDCNSYYGASVSADGSKSSNMSEFSYFGPYKFSFSIYGQNLSKFPKANIMDVNVFKIDKTLYTDESGKVFWKEGDEKVFLEDEIIITVNGVEIHQAIGDVNKTASTVYGVYGDVNQDGEVNAKDATIILRYAAYRGTGGKSILEEFVKA